MELYKKFDYWECRELIEISNDARINPGDRLQETENKKFNEFLDKYSNKKFNWEYLNTKYSLRQIKNTAPEDLK